MIETIRKKNGELVPYDNFKIVNAIFKAAQATGYDDFGLALELGKKVENLIFQRFHPYSKEEFSVYKQSLINESITAMGDYRGMTVLSLIGATATALAPGDPQWLPHPSNSAHVESAMVGTLGIQLGGGAFCKGAYVSRPLLGDNSRDTVLKNIRDASCIAIAVSLLMLLVMCGIQFGIKKGGLF